MVVFITAAVIAALIHAFAAVGGTKLAEGLVSELASKVASGLIRPSEALQQLGLDWHGFLDHVPGPVRRWFENLEHAHECLFSIVFSPSARCEISPGHVVTDEMDVNTLAEAKAVVVKRCPDVVFAPEWQPMVASPNPVWSHAFLNAFTSLDTMQKDPMGTRAFATILYRGDSAPDAGAKLKGAAAGTKIK